MSSPTLLEMKQKILADILKVSAFQQTGASTIPYSFDLMKLAGSLQTLKETARAYQLLFRSENLHQTCRIAGVSPAGEAFAALLSYLEKKPLLWLSSMETTPHRRITGLLQPGDSVLLVDGIQASSLGEAAGIVQAEGGLVSDALVLISDRHTGATSERPLKVHSLLSVSEIVDYVASNGSRQ
jgi:orotate phosphoribosyltransferase